MNHRIVIDALAAISASAFLAQRPEDRAFAVGALASQISDANHAAAARAFIHAAANIDPVNALHGMLVFDLASAPERAEFQTLLASVPDENGEVVHLRETFLGMLALFDADDHRTALTHLDRSIVDGCVNAEAPIPSHHLVGMLIAMEHLLEPCPHPLIDRYFDWADSLTHMDIFMRRAVRSAQRFRAELRAGHGA